ncbi:MAG: mechanosensitive ion channel family protein [Flavobacteriia bacterium]|nr:mechanosensitive ion channel family protein [Flavobacteriia bacterium]OIP46906.1 MAG: mechanosensitive ion channel protein MscS [Flavobacteriaceae bacterium CG2_30_31_66]PIV97032.1 MAG: mechanosensitive ion channel protein MscS [Flavobacteriaceae bacterium CG17_big_fil_post_rev_8_21_14_2_50_31_13]PIX14500.1 MAG: mechanosensitive ion channel protein MscS [Flavobacteriaceae bacterium CG_4_8_14_3_um_filter_31_8]PIY16341.1 MAG: mechanosensitive ion channel protein MscS [Flavobacteriaceae bacteri
MNSFVFKNFDLNKSFEKVIEKLYGWGEEIILKAPNFLLAILVFVIFWYLGKYLRYFIKKVLLQKVGQESIKSIISRTTFIITVMIGFFSALAILDLDKVLTSVLAGAGVVGLAIGLALQGTLHNTFSGFILSFLPNIQINDWIASNGYEGKVTDINLRSVTILEADNNAVVIPNSKIIDTPFKNFSIKPRSNIIITCGVSYESDLEIVKKVTIEAIEALFKQDVELGEKIDFFYTAFGDSSINYMIRFWTPAINRKDILDAQSNGIMAIKSAYNKYNINIPFPIRTLDFGKNKFRSETITVQGL